MDAPSNPKTPMDLAVVIESFARGGGGAERSTGQIVAELVERGHRVTVLAGWSNRRQLSGATVREYRSEKWSGAWHLWRFTRWARREIDRGGFTASLSVTTAVPATVVQPRSGTIRETLARNVAMRGNSGFRALKRLLVGASIKQRLLLGLEGRTLRDPRVRRVAAVSAYVARQLQEHYGVAPGRIVVIPNAATMPAADEAQRRAWRQQVRQGFNIPEDARVFLFAALNPRLKGLGTLLRAVDGLRSRGRKPILLLAGEVRYAQQHQVASLGLRDAVRIVGPTEHMAELYCAADVTVLPTYYDPSSKVVIESLMMGTPAISTRYNGASDFILAGDGSPGGSPVPRAGVPAVRGASPGGSPVPRGRVIADPGDHVALAQAMEELWDGAELERCRAATAGLGEELSMRRHVERLEALLVEAAAEARGAGVPR